MRRVLLVLAGLAAAGAACAAQTGPAPAAANAQAGRSAIGRLFYTPAERAALDVARVQKPAAPAAAQEAPEAPPPPQVVSYGGLVRRSDGRAMLWINNRLVDEKEALAGIHLKGKVRSDGAVTLQVPETGRSIEIKVGQSVEIQTGKVAETRKPRDDEKSAPGATPAAPADAKGAAPESKGAAADGKAQPPESKGPARGADAAAPPQATGAAGAKPASGAREEAQARTAKKQ